MSPKHHLSPLSHPKDPKDLSFLRCEPRGLIKGELRGIRCPFKPEQGRGREKIASFDCLSPSPTPFPFGESLDPSTSSLASLAKMPPLSRAPGLILYIKRDMERGRRVILTGRKHNRHGLHSTLEKKKAKHEAVTRSRSDPEPPRRSLILAVRFL